MDRAELARRLKAARALAGYTKPLSLAQHPLLVENGIKASRIREMESLKRRFEIRPMELDVIAQACGLPVEFFSAPFERLAEQAALSERMEALERALVGLQEQVPSPEALLAEARRQAAEDADAAGTREPAGQKRTG